MASHAASLSVLKELFPDWSEEDLSICLEESRGDLDTAITRISEGHATKFGEVTKKKEKAPKRVEHGNGRGRGRGASTGAPRGRSDLRGRGRGRGASTSIPPNAGRTAVETTPQWADAATTTTTTTTGQETTPAWADDVETTIASTQSIEPPPIAVSDTVDGERAAAAAKLKMSLIEYHTVNSNTSLSVVKI